MCDLKNQRLLVISPHPDDEVLGCGGLIRRIKKEGGEVFVLFLTVGVTMDYSEKGISTGQERLKEIEAVSKFLHYDGHRVAFMGDDYHLKMDQIPKKDLINEIENGKDISLNTIKPTMVAFPRYSDYNQDHHACSDAVLAAVRPAPTSMKPLQKMVIAYESVPTADWWTPTEHKPNMFISLDDEDLDAKINALKLYKSQVRTNYHPRSPHSMTHLAYYRGMHAGTKAAEAFFNYRQII